MPLLNCDGISFIMGIINLLLITFAKKITWEHFSLTILYLAQFQAEG